MTAFTQKITDPQAALETVGGKGESLAKMIRAGLPVPDGFFVTTEAYRRFVAENSLQTQIMAVVETLDPTDPAALDRAALQIGELFERGQMPAAVAQDIAAAYAALAGVPVAVRSSATAEDLPGASFAGQQETYLNIRGAEAVLAAVQKCWASLWTARAISYRIHAEIDPNSVALAVVVQELVPADAAGILFTANPINGKTGEMVINAAWGLGEAVVSGAVTPDTITIVKKTGHVTRREIAEKLVMTVRTEDGTTEQPVPNEKRIRPALTGAQTAQLARLGRSIEDFYGMPMDVEWALANGKFAILQARPITSLPLAWPEPERGLMLARGSLAEHTPNPVSPLFGTLGLALANQATQAMWDRLIGKQAKNLVGETGFYRLQHGYVYGGMMMRAKDMPGILRMSISQIGPIFRGSVERWQTARAALALVVDAWEQKSMETLPPSTLLQGVREVFLAASRYFTDIQTTLPAASSSEVLFTRLYNSLIRRKDDPEAVVFLVGSDTVALRAEKSLYDLAQWLQQAPPLAAYVAEQPVETLLRDFQAENPPQAVDPSTWMEWRQRFQQHVQAFGRTSYDFDFGNPTPQEDPAPMLEMLKGFLAGSGSSPYERQRAALERREQAAQAVLRRTGWPRRQWFQKLLRWAQETAPMREDSIFDMGMGHTLIRRMLARLGQQFASGGAIEQADDIYWLVQSEVEDLTGALERGAALSDLREAVADRKKQRKAYEKLSPPVMLPEKSGWSFMIHGAEVDQRDGRVVLRGIGTSAGKITAPAAVIHGPEDFGTLRKGDVLVAVTTTPAWTPLFALASAVVTDIGGPLSHSSIVAREYGIPAVMAARNATRWIQTGQMVTVDGSAGTVELEPLEDATSH